MEAVETFLALLEDAFTTDLFAVLFDCTVGRFTVVFLTDEVLLFLLEELLLIEVFLGLLLTSFFTVVLVFPEGLDTTALLLVTELPLPLILLAEVVLLTVLWTFPLSFWRIEELLETDLSFLALGELLLTVVLLLTVLFPLLLLRWVVVLETLLSLPLTVLLLDVVLLETLLFFL